MPSGGTLDSGQAQILHSEHHSYQILSQAGAGSHATCFHAKDVKTGESFALKVAKFISGAWFDGGVA